MALAYGRWPGVVAIVADGEMSCVLCAQRRYGVKGVQAVIESDPEYEQYEDRTGNVLTVLLRGSADLHTEQCHSCHVPLCDEACGCYRDPEQWRQFGTLPVRMEVMPDE